MTSSVDRILVYSGIGLNVVSIATAVVPHVVHLPDEARPWAIAVAGLSLAYLLRKKIPESKTVPLPNVASAAALAITAILIAAVVVWPGPTSQESSTPRNLSATIGQLRKNITPKHNAEIGECVRVSGDGTIPGGYDVWVANLNDINGSPDLSELFGFQHAAEVNGQNSWSTNPFSVGSTKDAGKQYWIFVYLVPDSISSILANIALPHGYAVSLKAPIADAHLIDELPVVRTAATCT